MLSNNFELKPMRRRSAQVHPLSALPKYASDTPVSQVPGADYFLSSRIECDNLSKTQSSLKDNVRLYKVDNPNRRENDFRRRSAPSAHITTKIVSLPATSFGDFKQPQTLQNISPPPTLSQSCLKRSTSMPVVIKSCFQRKSIVEVPRRKSVQFFGFVQVQYTHSKADYDRSTIGCLANPVENRDETTESFKQWQQEMNEILTEKRPESPCPPFCSPDSDVESVSSLLDSEDEPEIKETEGFSIQIVPTVSKFSSFTPNIKAPVFVPSSYIPHVDSAAF
ncbi:hypothetical protein HK096_000741 [Nowakowskiella sp. JEL0078]|nr:hypothetical protein HK096_000741 [Nowakowskiella sp. JEL0078]